MMQQLFYQGIVEDRNDPLKLGRVKVRIIGIHSDNRTSPHDSDFIPVSDLPFAEPAYPITGNCMSGSSDFAVPLNGNLVWIFFKDPEMQYPVYFAISSRIHKEQPDFSKGFSDPDKVYPKSDSLGESPISRMGRSEKLDQTIVQKKKDEVDTFITCQQVVQEPATPHATKYPNGRIIETPSGHVIEFDDTEGAERIHIYHKSGTFHEIHPNADEVNKIKGNSFTIILKDDHVHIKGNSKIRIDGNAYMEIGGDSFSTVAGNTGIIGGGNVNANIGGTATVTCGGVCTVRAPRIDLNP